MKRFIVVGTFTRAITRRPPSSITTSKFSERLEMCGKGCAGSMASGVRIGSMSRTNLSLSSRRSAARTLRWETSLIPSSSRAGMSSLLSILRRSSKNPSVC
jgi:hypothetical protein